MVLFVSVNNEGEKKMMLCVCISCRVYEMSGCGVFW